MTPLETLDIDISEAAGGISLRLCFSARPAALEPDQGLVPPQLGVVEDGSAVGQALRDRLRLAAHRVLAEARQRLVEEVVGAAYEAMQSEREKSQALSVANHQADRQGLADKDCLTIAEAVMPIPAEQGDRKSPVILRFRPPFHRETMVIYRRHVERAYDAADAAGRKRLKPILSQLGITNLPSKGPK